MSAVNPLEGTLRPLGSDNYQPPSADVQAAILAMLQPGLQTRPIFTHPEFNPRAVRYVMNVALPEMRVDARWTGTNGFLGRYRLIPLESYFLEESNDTPEGLLDRDKSKRQVEWTTWDNVICLVDQNAQYGAVYFTALTDISDHLRASRILVAVLGGVRWSSRENRIDTPLVDVRAYLENRVTENTKDWGTSSESIRAVFGTPEYDEHERPTNDAARAEVCRQQAAQAHAAGEAYLSSVWFDSVAKVAQKRKSKLDKFDYYCARMLRITPPERELAEASKQMAAGALEQNAALVRDVVTAVMQQTGAVGAHTANTAEIDGKLAEIRAAEERIKKMLEDAQTANMASAPASPASETAGTAGTNEPPATRPRNR